MSEDSDGTVDWDEAAPRADALVESLRSFGYTPQAAIADLLDNSLSARAKSMDLEFVWGDEPHVAIVDDGDGMGETALVEAMRPGSLSPLATRRSTDLGRFGLGLKTASFSQARELTVITRSNTSSEVHIRRWDLDVIGETGQWRLLRTPAEAARGYVDRVRSTRGTAVVWTKCDRLVGDLSRDPEKANDRFFKMAREVEAHLGMTFHRFLSQRPVRIINVNGNRVQPWDPILKHPATHLLGTDKILFRGSTITVRPWVLPHRSKLSDEQTQEGAGIRGWNAQQGFYVYRNDRLVVAGDWLGAAGAKDEHTKLARITVDFDSSLDLAWQIDVKKSTARPPGVVMEDLRRIAAATRRAAEEVYRHRGNVVPRPSGGDRPLVMAWQEFKDRTGAVSLRLNRGHPLIQDALGGSASQKHAVERVLKLVEETLPTSLIGIRLAEALDKQVTPFEARPQELAKLLSYALDTMLAAGQPRKKALDELARIEPFCHYPTTLESFRDGES